MGKSPSHIEIELKLTGPDAAIQHVEADMKANGIKLEERAFRVQTYYDTHDLALFSQDLELRVRAAKDDYRQTIKRHLSLTRDHLFTREEWQSAQSDELPRLDKLQPFLPKAMKRGMDALHPLIRTEFARNRVLFDIGDALVECAIDRGRVVFVGTEGDVTRDFTMLELELKDGKEKAMAAFGKRLSKYYGLSFMRITKPEMAVQLGYETGSLLSKKARMEVASKIKNRLG